MTEVEELIKSGDSKAREIALLKNKGKLNFISVETMVNQMSYHYYMGMSILRIFQWITNINREGGKWVFLCFAQLNWKKKKFKDEYMRTIFF